jgi:phosphoribosylformylglycinamidine synthase
VERTDLAFTAKAKAQQVLRIPISHNDGSYFADAATLSHLERNGQVALRYCTAEGLVVPSANPNGSVHNIAGIVNEAGNVLGMMPHPERAGEQELGGVDGLLMFQSVAAASIKVLTA